MADRVRIEGLADFRRDLRAMSLSVEGRGLTGALRSGAQEVAAAAGPLLHSRSGKMAAGYKAGAAGTNAYVRNRHPGAAVQEFGGIIRPRGTPITIRPQLAVTRALDSKTDKIVDRVGDALDVLAMRHGWR